MVTLSRFEKPHQVPARVNLRRCSINLQQQKD